MPHRQFVFALPKALRIYFRHDRRLFGHVSRLIYHIIQEFYHQAAGRPIRTGVVIAHQTFGDMLRWNPHFHAIVLEGGFDDQGTFVYIPLGHLQAMTELLRRRVVALLVDQKLLDRRFARNIPARVQLIRRYGLYSSRIKGHWTRMPYVLQRAPSGWTSQNDQNAATASNRAGSPEVPATETDAPDARERRHAWARLLARVYEVDPLVCPRCGARLRVIAVIQNPVQIKKILNHLVRTGRAPPGLDPTTLD